MPGRGKRKNAAVVLPEPTAKKAAKMAAAAAVDVEEESGDDESDIVEANPFQRLFPSRIRLQPDENGRFVYRDGSVMNFKDMNRMNDEFLLKTDLSVTMSSIATFRMWVRT
jgi:hypothetical protein